MTKYSMVSRRISSATESCTLSSVLKKQSVNATNPQHITKSKNTCFQGPLQAVQVSALLPLH